MSYDEYQRVKKLLEQDKVDDVAKGFQAFLAHRTLDEALERAARFGSMKVLRWLVADKGATPAAYCVRSAVAAGDFDTVYFLLERDWADKAGLADLQWLFGAITDAKADAFEKVDPAAWGRAFGVMIPAAPTPILARIVVGMCAGFQYLVTPGNLLVLERRLEPEAMYYVIGNVTVCTPMLIDIVAKFYRTRLDPARLADLCPRFAAPMTSGLARLIVEEKFAPPSLIEHMRTRGQAFSECPFVDTVNGLKEIMAVLDIGELTWQQWLAAAVSARSLLHVQQFIAYGARLGYVGLIRPEAAQVIFLAGFVRFHAEIARTMIATFPLLNEPKWIDWVGDVLRPLGRAKSAQLREKLTEAGQEFLRLVDFDVPMPPRAEVWRWWGVDFTGGATYVRSAYKDDIEIDSKFAHLLTLADIAANIDWLNEEMHSPTSCYFEISGEIFFRDQQDCILWAVEKKTGRIYIHNNDDLFKRVFVAKSMPEFLSRVDQENKAWFADNGYE